MSLDIWLSPPKCCPHCGAQIAVADGAELFERNVTHNLTPMWRKAGVYEALYMSEGKPAKEFIEIIHAGLSDMQQNYSDYVPLNPFEWLGRCARRNPLLPMCFWHLERTQTRSSA